MSKPIVAAASPIKVDLEIGKKYFYCACGQSAAQPFCDGSHKGSEITPIGFVAEQESCAMCRCKHTNNAPYCDGSHNQLSAADINTEGQSN
jgi:CDGSH-type Zn-finger protein|tara:strand:+ start:2582 stop:2854 length:273 start_codon:yes stop_codon:yes gene_type:complete